MIRKKKQKEVYGFTMPLVTTKNGTKFGKSEGNALWLDKNKTSSYKMYQYLINLEDEMIIDYLKIFTFLSKDEIEKIAIEVKNNPEQRLAQKTLAKEIITFLHGEEEYQRALKLTEKLFSNDFNNLEKKDIVDIFNEEEIKDIKINKNIIDILVDCNIASSKREAREFVLGNAISINGEKVNDPNIIIDNKYLIDNTYIIFKRGKKNYYTFKAIN